MVVRGREAAIVKCSWRGGSQARKDHCVNESFVVFQPWVVRIRAGLFWIEYMHVWSEFVVAERVEVNECVLECDVGICFSDTLPGCSGGDGAGGRTFG